MKALTLAVAVAVVVAIIGVQQSSADLVIEVSASSTPICSLYYWWRLVYINKTLLQGPELMDGLTNGSPAAAGQDNPEDSWKVSWIKYRQSDYRQI